MSTRPDVGLAFILVASLSGLPGCADDRGRITDADVRSPGTITITVTGVTGAQGRLLITEARTTDRQAAVSCTPIDADPFSATAVLEEIVGPTPCEVSTPVTLVPGVYDLRTVVIQGGSMTPDACADTSVVVDGNVTVTIPALGAC